MIHRLLKYRGLGINLLAGGCFIVLAVVGWGLSWAELINYLGLLLICLVGLIGAAACFGWLLRRAIKRKKD